MADQRGGAPQPLEALAKSASHLRRLKNDLAQAQTRHVALLNEVLDSAESNPSQFSFGVVEDGETIAEGQLTPPIIGLLRVIGGFNTQIPPGEGAGCPERVGCANIAQNGDKCYYLCFTVKA